MKRLQLEHLLRAASAITGENEFFVIGSQSILGTFPDAPDEVIFSVEADLIALHNSTERANEIDGVLGELSSFHETYGYYAQGVEVSTAVLPAGWRERVVPIENANTRGAKGYCLDPHDLALSKYAANRPKDRDFIRACMKHRLVDATILLSRLAELPVSHEQRELISGLIPSDAGQV